ncbi:phosphatidylserine decarboxylase family protein [Vibrio nigripulchritudo]|uniref:phosphatidylserine decarboxylase family protein n=1 Tax=Vibrio nigripulchritudo TaxID=28173 RepID=UPI0003B1BC7B|nr:phosphatidylserine decarboxylase family protein [Vibrio nigripulchritudo]CCN72239.1 Phosphatidylserine decarboxylase-related [Vibrio nigripulchritudo SFn118]
MNPATLPYRVGGWLTSDAKTLNQWLIQIAVESAAADLPLKPSIRAFKEYIEGDPTAFMLFTNMFNERPKKHNPPIHGGDGGDEPVHIVKSYEQMLDMCNYVLHFAPEYNQTGLVGFPINAIIDRAMATESGYAAFTKPCVNRHFKNILNAWGQFLLSGESTHVLNDSPSGWFCASALKQMTDEKSEEEAKAKFIEMFDCEPNKEHWGFRSWDEFFTRTFNEGQRPVASPQDDNVIANACESAPYKFMHNVKLRDHFWIKGQPYSLQHMLNNNADYYREFDGGTVYQAYLSASKYHRWHSPVDGIIEHIEYVDGTYYAETPAIGEDTAGPNESQGFITEMATRAIIYIRANNPAIGLMAFMAVGMAEVSSCEVTVQTGDSVRKGEQLGMFHFGGSTHCLIFRPNVELKFHFNSQPQPILEGQNYLLSEAIDVRAEIATVLG